MTEQRRRVSIGFALLVAVLGIVMFVVPSAFVASRGAPWWLCMTVGALAFPVLPVVWQLFAERRRRSRLAAAKTSNKAVLTGGDRFVMRCLAIAVVAVGPAFALDGKGAISTVLHNVGWIIPPTPWPGHTDGPILSHVPVDAEIVVSVHKDAEVKEHKSAVDAVMGYADHKLMLFATGDDDHVDRTSTDVNDELDKLPIKIDHVSTFSTGSPTYYASDSWRAALDAATGPNADIRALIARAPTNATAVIAVSPKTTPELKPIKSAVGWLIMTDESLKIEGQIDAVDAPSAALAFAAVRAAWKKQQDKLPDKCREPIDKLADKLHVDQSGASIHVSIEIPMSSLGDVMLCGWKS